MKRMFTGISLQTALFAFTFIVTGLAVGLVGSFSFYKGRQAVNDVALQLRMEISGHIMEHVRAFLDVPHAINQANARALSTGLLPVDDQAALAERFADQIHLFDSVSSVYFGNVHGGLANSGREPGDDALYVILTDDFQAGTFRKFALDDQGNRGQELTSFPDFDARTRPWFVQARDRGESVWNEPYILFTGQDMAMAASRPVHDARGAFLGVVSVDIFLSHLSSFLQSLRIGSTGQAFILDTSGNLVASSNGESLITDDGSGALSRLRGVDSKAPLIQQVVGRLQVRFGDLAAFHGSQRLDIKVNGERVFAQVSAVPVEPAGRWLVVVAIPERDFMAGVASANWALLFLTAGSLAVALLVGALLSGRIVRPIAELRTAAEKLSRGEEASPIQGFGFSEVQSLNESFNKMAGNLSRAILDLRQELHERKQAEEERDKVKDQLLHARKMQSLGVLAGGIAHDFNNILQTLGGNLQMLLASRPADDPDSRRLNIMATSVDRAARLVRQLLLFSRKAESSPTRVDLNQEVRNAVSLLEHSIPRMIEIVRHPGEGLWPIHVDPAQVEQVILNLCSNAADAMPHGGRLVITTSNLVAGESSGQSSKHLPAGRYVTLAVMDTGSGMDAATQAQIFDPFFTTKEIGRGTGLGLASVYGIVTAHGGHIRCSSVLGLGTTFTIHWPAMPDSGNTDMPPVAGEEDSEAGPGGEETILVVDDEEYVRELSVEALKMSGYTILEAANGEEALDIYARHGGSIALVMLDLSMPGMGGHQCLRELLRLNPRVKVLVASGFSSQGQAHEVLRAGAAGFIAKPHPIKKLLAKVREVLRGE